MKLVDSPAVRIERHARERGELEVFVAVVALLESARVLAGNTQRWPWLLAATLAVAAALRVLRRGLWARQSAPHPARVKIAEARVLVEGDAMRRTLALAEPREGWATQIERGAVIALCTGDGGLVSCQALERADAASALEEAGLGTAAFPRRFTLDRAGPWNGWLAVTTRRGIPRLAVILAAIGGAALASVAPLAGTIYGYALLAVVLVVRALALRHPPRVTVEPGAITLDALGFHRRVGLARMVSVQETPGGVSVLSADGAEVLLPLATRAPIRRASAKPWHSEAELRDAALARREALADAVRAAREHRSGAQAYRAADGRDVRGAFGVR